MRPTQRRKAPASAAPTKSVGLPTQANLAEAAHATPSSGEAPAAAPGILYLVPNTLDLGTTEAAANLQELLPLSVIRTAAALGHWVAESAKVARAFLKRVDAVVPLSMPLQSVSITELPRAQKGSPQPAPTPLAPLLSAALQGHDIGLISDAGLPAVADPGAALVQAAHSLGIRVVALPGASSLLLAVAASGLNGQSFAFVGYLPVEAAERASRIRELELLSRRQRQTQLMIETPYRNEALLGALLAHLQPNTRLSVSCGLSMPSAFTRSDSVSRWRSRPQTLPADVPAVFCLLAD
jgi:16S rRNA (cytidine1402-2'-O)-methyltransferase